VEDLHFVVRMGNNIECEGQRTDKPNSQWIRGHLVGGASEALGVKMDCRETRCMAMGDPYCEFELHKAKA
jgi:predicted hydrocarbon binding protein